MNNSFVTQRVIERLQELLKQEYRQRDLYESYVYWLLGQTAPGIRSEIEEHIGEEMEHVKILQRYLADLGGDPVIDRLPIPRIDPDMQSLLEADLYLEIEAVENYADFIVELEKLGPQWSSLRVDVENILVQEQEHVHDLRRWLRPEDYFLI